MIKITIEIKYDTGNRVWLMHRGIESTGIVFEWEMTFGKPYKMCEPIYKIQLDQEFFTQEDAGQVIVSDDDLLFDSLELLRKGKVEFCEGELAKLLKQHEETMPILRERLRKYLDDNELKEE